MITSPSTWGCGLKLMVDWLVLVMLKSPSTWGCGLKHGRGDWNLDPMCHPLREGVDWNCKYYVEIGGNARSPSTWGCGLKPVILMLKTHHYFVTLYVRVWIETARSAISMKTRTVTLYVRVWIETILPLYCQSSFPVTLYVRVWIETYAESLGNQAGMSPSTWGCGLKQIRWDMLCTISAVTLYVRVWIETFCLQN